MRKNKISGIYCIENKVNKKKYIGQSTSIQERWNKHKSKLKHNNHYNEYLQKSFNKYGIDNFSFYILEECEPNKLDEREIYYINKYNTLNPKYGFNLKEGGQEVFGTLTKSAKEKQKEGVKKSYENPDLIAKRKEDALRQWNNPDIKAKIMGENNGMYGKTHTPEVRKLLSEINKGRIPPNKNNTPVLCVELNKIFECAAVAMKELNIKTHILQVCYGNRKTAGGYHWQFVTENNI